VNIPAPGISRCSAGMDLIVVFNGRIGRECCVFGSVETLFSKSFGNYLRLL
jgi:hypothetical protein